MRVAGGIGRLLAAQDMTRGQPLKGLIRFSAPLVVGSFAQQLYSIVDALVVSRYSQQHDAALVAIAAAGSICNVLMVPLLAIAMSGGILVSQRFGAKDADGLSGAVESAIWVTAALSALITIPGIALAPWMLRQISTPHSAMGIATEYLRIILVGWTANGLYLILSCVLRSLGDALWPLALMLGAVLLNLVLDLWFLVGLGWGIQGAAWASVLSQTVAALLCAVRLSRMEALRPGKGAPDRALLERMLRLAIPAGVTQGALSFGILLIQSLTNRMGERAAVAAMAVMRVDGFAMLHCFAIGHATATFVGQNVGARRLDRVQLGTRDALRLSLSASLVMALALLVFGGNFVGLFSGSAEVRAMGSRAFWILAASYLALSAAQVYGGVIRGAGQMVPTMWISLGAHFLVRVPVAYAVAHVTRSPQWPGGSPDALFVALAMTRAATALLSYLWCAHKNRAAALP